MWKCDTMTLSTGKIKSVIQMVFQSLRREKMNSAKSQKPIGFFKKNPDSRGFDGKIYEDSNNYIRNGSAPIRQKMWRAIQRLQSEQKDI